MTNEVKEYTVEVTFSMPGNVERGGGITLGRVLVTGPVEGHPVIPQAILAQRILGAALKDAGITNIEQVK